MAAWGARQDWFGTGDDQVEAIKPERKGIKFLAQRCADCRQEAVASTAVTPTPAARELSELVDRIHASIRAAQMRLVTIFKVSDSNADGVMSPAELQLHMGKIGCKFSEVEAATVVTALDVDGDGGVSVQEFITFMRGYRPGQLLQPKLSVAQRIAVARHERVDGYLQASNVAVYQEVWRGLCEWLDVHVLQGASCRVKGWCRLVYVDAWRYHGGRRRKGQLPLLVLDDEWALTHGVRLARGVTTVAADTSSGHAVVELTPVSLGQRCRVPGTDSPMDRHATAEVLALLLHTLGSEAAAGIALTIQLGVCTRYSFSMPICSCLRTNNTIMPTFVCTDFKLMGQESSARFTHTIVSCVLNSERNMLGYHRARKPVRQLPIAGQKPVHRTLAVTS